MTPKIKNKNVYRSMVISIIFNTMMGSSRMIITS